MRHVPCQLSLLFAHSRKFFNLSYMYPPPPLPTTVCKVNQNLLKVEPIKKLWTMTARASDFFPVSVG